MRLSFAYTVKFYILVLLSLRLLLLTGYSEGAQAREEFSNASLKGDYATVNIGRGGYVPQAGISVASYDGKGNFSGTTIQDVPGPGNRERVFLKASFNGTYKVDGNGTGTGTITTNLPDGSKHQVNIVFVITEAETLDGVKIATEFSFIHETLSLTGNLFTLVATRLPDGGKFTNASLKGNYAYTLLGLGGPLPQAAVGLMNYDGNSSFTGTAIVNLPGPTFGARTFVTAPFVRPYTVNPDGTGTATPPGESDIAFVITRADRVGDIKVAREVFFIVRELNPVTGNLLTGVIKKLPD